jgi:hypothetical protein
MRPPFPSSVFLVLSSAFIVGITWARCPGCLDRARQNDTCEWTGDNASPMDPNNPAHQQHLVHDAQLAEDLAVRYADAEHERRFGWPGHGGQIEHGRLLKDCMARLVPTIERNHAVTAEQVQAARPRRNLAYDAGVWLSFLLVYLVGAAAASRWVARRFVASTSPVHAAFTGLASVAVSFLGIQVGAIWSALGEIVRLHNGHFGTFRASRSPWAQHLDAVFVLGVVLCWIIALAQRRGNSDRGTADVAILQSLLLP